MRRRLCWPARLPVRTVLAVACPALLLVAGCGAGAPGAGTLAGQAPSAEVAAVAQSASGQGPTAREAPEVALGASCTSPAGYSVQRPSDWSVNPGDVLPACSWFDPEPFAVPEGTDVRTAITMRVETASGTTALTPDERSRVAMVVDGRPAHRIEQVTTAGLYPVGTPVTSYVVDLGAGRVLLAETVGLAAAEHERNVAVLDAMMQSLQLPDADRI